MLLFVWIVCLGGMTCGRVFGVMSVRVASAGSASRRTSWDVIVPLSCGVRVSRSPVIMTVMLIDGVSCNRSMSCCVL